MASGDGSGADGDGADIPDAHRFLSSVSRSDLARQLRARGLPVPADLLHSLTDAPGDGEAIPYVHEFLSQASLAWVAAGMRDAGRPVPSGIHPAAAGEGIPFVHDLLSGASLAYVAHGLAAEGREVASGLRAALGRLKQVDPRIAAATATAAAAPAGPPGEGSGGRFPERIGPYRLIRRLGKGGMGTVYACRREDGDETLAIKVINAGRLADPADRLRFKQEIAVLLRLRHEHVCRLRDFGQEGDSYWFVMDFVDGREIDEWCKAERPDQARIATVMAQVCRAVGHAHRQGIVHRDLTPANIMITGDGRPVVMDFGLARDMDAGPSMTITGMTVGTPPFMAPEQTMGKAGSITRTTDVWGAGATLYFLLTGVPPHQGDNTFEVFKAINERMVRRPRELRADIDPSLELVILSCLQQDPRDRYRDMDSLARDLEEIAAGRRVRVRLPGFVTTMGRRIRRHPLPWMLTIALAGTGIGFLTYVASQQIREWGAWTSMGTYRAGAPLPAGLMALDHTLAPRDMPPPQPDGLPYIGDPSNYQRGWWWLEAPGMDGDLRISAEFTLITPDTMEFA
ncbi:MAG: Serine/threonine-protein kinase PrkC, partial [Planctomycetota bacterium]